MNNAAGHSGLACNVEFKARLASAVKAHQVARELATAPVEQQFQLDTYFSCQHGRLKLREIDHQRGQLIWYQRANQAMARESHYRLVEIADPEPLRYALSDALGVSGKVEKQRTIYWFENVRIHLDEVVSLGDFLEFEAIITDTGSRKAAEAKLQGLSEAFSLCTNDLLTMSYGDMVSLEESISDQRDGK